MSNFCSACGFPVSNGEFCSNCGDKEMEGYRKVKEYLRSYPNSNAMQVANATGISISKITRYLRDGLLSSSREDSPRRFR